jgi:hypothetical protein
MRPGLKKAVPIDDDDTSWRIVPEAVEIGAAGAVG